MSPKSEKLAQRIQEVQKLVSGKIGDQDETFKTVFQNLENIADRLKIEKLTVQIVSSNLISAQALQKFLNACKALPEFYQFEVNLLPTQSEQAEPESSAALVLQASFTGQQQLRYELSPTQEVAIGRNPECEIYLAPGLYKKVSWHHAKVQPLSQPDADRNSGLWQICDLNSTNGTYINGKRLQGCQALQTGDRIALAAPSTNQANPEFIFEYQPALSTTEDDKLYKQVVDCDVLCLIIDPRQPLSTNEKWFIAKVSVAQIARRVIIADVPKTASEEAERIESQLAEIDTWLQSKTAGESFELAPLHLRPFYPYAQKTEVDAGLQKELEKFGKSLEALVKRKPEDVLAQRLTAQVLVQLVLVERVFDAQEEALRQEVQQQEEKLQELAKDDLKEQTKKALRKVSDDKDKFFKQVKIELSQSKAALLDPYSKKSIFNLLQLFIDNLRPFVAKGKGSKYVQLRSESTVQIGDVNIELLDFCSSALDQWANQEWERICSFYVGGGLNGLFHKVYATLNFIPSLNLENSLFQPDKSVDIQKSLLNSFIGVPCESRYKEVSPIGYVVKQIRSNMMQAMFLIGLLAMLGGAAIGSKQLLAGIAEYLRNTPWLFGIVLFILISSLTYAYRNDNSLKLEEIAEKLKKDLSNHYQALAKNLAERLVQDFGMALEAEERRMKEALEIVNEKFTDHIIDIEKRQLMLKNSIEQQKVQQKNLEKEKAEFQKLKRI